MQKRASNSGMRLGCALCATLALVAAHVQAQGKSATDDTAPAQSQTGGNKSATAQDTSSPTCEPQIRAVSPGSARPGTAVALDLACFSKQASGENFRVLFDAEPGEVRSYDGGVLVAIVPDTLSDLNTTPRITVTDSESTAFLYDALEVLLPSSKAAAATDLWRRPTTWLFGLGALGIAALGYFLGRRPRAEAMREEPSSTASAKTPGAPPATAEPETAPAARVLELPPPELPERLVTALAEGEAVAHLGSSLGVLGGVPRWSRMVLELLAELHQLGVLDDSQNVSIQTVLGGGQEEYAAQALNQALRSNPRQMTEALRTVIERHEPRPSSVHKRLTRLPFAAWLSGSFDELLEQAFGNKPPPRYTPDDAERALDALSRDEPFVYKLYGSAFSDAPLIFGVQQFVDRVRDNSAYEELLDKLFLTRTLFFVGTSVAGVEAFLRGIELRSAPTRAHFALIVVEDETWEIKADVLRERFGIHVLPVAGRNPVARIEAFLEALDERAKSLRRSREREGDTRGSRRRAVLAGVTVKNIGPFHELTLPLDRHWNLLLGDNGVGKSTILKSIAVALCGEDALPYAGRIINRDSTMGEVYLNVAADDDPARDQEAYSTAIRRRTGGGVKIESGSLPALDREHWLAVGFPALRTITWERPRSEGSLGSRRPTTADVLPILSDEPDPRLDGLKQRIVTLDHLSKTERLEGAGNGGHGRLMKEFFRIFDIITEGMSVHFSSIDPQTREITVRTEDGEIPLESLSQGTISLVSWVGVLLQRLYEVTPEGEDPLSRYVIVLIDEIDAHMHPAWQASIVAHLSRIFPRAQFIATTHSPLVVRGMDASQVIRFKRDENGAVRQVDVPDDMTMGRADQVLAGTLFDLDADLDEVTEANIAAYQRLLAKSERTPDEEAEFHRLENVLEFRIPVPVTSPPDRRAQELLGALLSEQFGGGGNDASKRVLERARELFEELEKERNKIARDGGTH